MGACLGKKDGKSKSPEPATQTTSTTAKTTTKTEAPVNSQPTKNDAGNKEDGTSKKQTKLLPGNRKIEGAEDGDIKDKYILGEEIGRGGFSIVVEATCREDGEKYAVKIVEKTVIQDEIKLLRREIEIMKQVEHENILKLIEIFEDDEKVYIVMELVDGSELFDRIVNKGYYSEKSTVHIVKQILNAVQYLHSKNIAHRDLKPENLLCSGSGSSEIVKIADFGLSKLFSGDEELTTSCGTPGYVAPEVLMSESYDKSVDMWGIGIITYILLAGYPPFYGDNDTQLFEKIMNAEYDFDDECWDDVSDLAKDFIHHLLIKNPEERFTAEQALQHPWITSTAPDKALNIHQRMSQYNLQRKEQAQRKAADDIESASDVSDSQ
jgi:calcium/calmodulin-dependent protein kinase I